MRTPGGGDEPGRQSRSSWARTSAIASACAGGGWSGSKSCTSCAADNTFCTRPTMSTVIGTRSAGHPIAQRGELGARPRRRRHQRVHRGVGAIVEQRGQRAVRVRAERQAGPRIQLPLNRFDRRRRRSAAPTAGCPGPSRRPARQPSRTPAGPRRCPRRRRPGKPRTVRPPTDALDDARQFVQVVGPAAQSGPLQLAGDRVGDGAPRPVPPAAPAARRGPCRGPSPRRRRTRRRTSPAGVRAACPGRRRRWAPEPRCDGAIRAAARPAAALSPGRSSASTARAVSGAGTKLRRRSFGSERISAVTSSSRSAGTCQANSSPPNRASTSTGTCTVTPSSAAPGSKR